MKEYQYKGSSKCGFCQNNRVFSRWTCLIDAKCKVDIHWCGERCCENNVFQLLKFHNQEYHASVDLV